MGFRILRRTKTLFLTFGLISLGMYMALNSLALEFSATGDVRLSEGLLKHPREMQMRLKKSNFPDEFHINFIAQGQRKPKTMNMGNDDHTDDNIIYEKDHRTINTLMDDDNEVVENHLKVQKRNKIGKSNVERYREQKDIRNKNPKNVPNRENIQNINKDYEGGDYTDEDDDSDYDDEEDDDEDDYQYDDATNPPFKPGDFGDIKGLEYYRKPKLKFAEVDILPGKVHLDKEPVNIDDTHTEGNDVDDERKSELIENGMFWSEYVESLIPRGLSYANVTKRLKQLRGQVVHTLERPGWDKCGRPLNGFAVLGDGTKMCARYRQPHSSFVYGEALSFYLSRLLRMDNVPAVILAQTNVTSSVWRAVNISSLSWKEDKTVALIQWIEDLNSGASSKAYIPPIILQAYRKGTPVTSHVIRTSRLLRRTPTHIAEVVQWGTMIVFDYLTGNYDRVASMQDAEDRESNPKIIEESIRNLRKSSRSGKLWLIDNESGFFDAYELLVPSHQISRFTTFHNKMLQTMCVFQSSLVNALKNLSEQPSPHRRLLNFASSFEPLMYNVPKDNLYFLFADMFDKRLADVIDWIRHCQVIDVG